LWVLPEKYQARLIVKPEIEKIQSIADESLKFKWNSIDGCFTFNKSSKIFLRGVNGGQADSARGLFADIVILDEFGSFDDANYVVNDVLKPTLLTTRGKMIIGSTPAKDLSHPYYDFKKSAINKKTLITKTIFDNESLTDQEIKKACDDVGGVEATAWRREYLCQEIADESSLVIPEFNEVIHVGLMPDDLKQKQRDAYVGIDLGFHDHTGATVGVFDHHENMLYVENEAWLNAANSQELVKDFRKAEEVLSKHHKIIRRVSDNDLQMIHDFNSLYKYSVLPVQKNNKEAAVNLLRIRFQENKIKINPRCKNLIYQLRVGMWKDARNFMRGEKTGHLDLIDSLIYLNRSINVNKKIETKQNNNDFETITIDLNPKLKPRGVLRHL